uniref:ATP binding protein n=1 Tax=Solanum tuberosum TaxID=4113 RepID=M1CXN6_SOLTU
MAPESVLDDEYETPADIWAFGCTVFEMITGKKVWDCTGINDPLHLLCKIGMQSPELHHDKLSKQAEDFLNKCVDRDSHSRWTADLLLNHPFLSSDNNDVHQRKRKELKLVDLCNSTELKLLTNKRRRKIVERC